MCNEAEKTHIEIKLGQTWFEEKTADEKLIAILTTLNKRIGKLELADRLREETRSNKEQVDAQRDAITASRLDAWIWDRRTDDDD